VSFFCLLDISLTYFYMGQTPCPKGHLHETSLTDIQISSSIYSIHNSIENIYTNSTKKRDS